LCYVAPEYFVAAICNAVFEEEPYYVKYVNGNAARAPPFNCANIF
jgi:hypothetical protein